jgi:hypothetical protein
MMEMRRAVIFFCLIGFIASVFGLKTASPALEAGAAQTWEKSLPTLKKIFSEVKEIGPYPGEDFIRREFFVGEDDDDTNKDISVVVLIQRVDDQPYQERMKIQVTEMERSRENPRVGYARITRSVSCLVVGNTVDVQESEFEERSLERLATQILKAIQDKKKLLKISLGGSGRPGSPGWPARRG